MEAALEVLDAFVQRGVIVFSNTEFETICQIEGVKASTPEAASFFMKRGWRYMWFDGTFFYSASRDARNKS